jgi:hypothetical protein
LVVEVVTVVVVVAGSVDVVVELVDVVDVVVLLVVVVVAGMHWLSTQEPSQKPQSISTPHPLSMRPHWAFSPEQSLGWQQLPNLSEVCARTQRPDPQLLLDLQREPECFPPASAGSAVSVAANARSAARHSEPTLRPTIIVEKFFSCCMILSLAVGSSLEIVWKSECRGLGLLSGAAEVPAQKVEQICKRAELLAAAGMEVFDAAADGPLGRPAAAANLDEKAVLGSDAAALARIRLRCAGHSARAHGAHPSRQLYRVS